MSLSLLFGVIWCNLVYFKIQIVFKCIQLFFPEYMSVLEFWMISVKLTKNQRTTPTIPRLDFRFPSSFENGTLRGSHAIRESVASEPVVVVVGSDGEEVKIIEPPARTVNYRKCILPFILGVALMITGIVMRKLFIPLFSQKPSNLFLL